MLKLSHSKPFYNTLNYASTANIEEVMRFYNLGDKTFETDFSTKCKFHRLICPYNYLILFKSAFLSSGLFFKGFGWTLYCRL